MAKSSGYFGLRRGSTKSHTFQVLNGKQITKDRVEAPKNPRTLAQMRQRAIITTCGSAYKAMKSICDHSFEGVSAGNLSMQRFQEINMSKLRRSVVYENAEFGINKWNVKGMMPGSYQLSDGTLPPCCPDLTTDSVNPAARQAVIWVANGLNIADICEELGVKQYGDIATICVAYAKADGSYGFGAVRLTYKQGADVPGSFDLAVCGDINAASIAFANSTLKLTIGTSFDWADGAEVATTYTAAICSQYRNGKWFRSVAAFDVTNAEPDYDEAIATYPVGQERFLNGDGSVQNGGAAPAPSTPSNPVNENAVLTVHKEGQGSSSVKVSGQEVVSGSNVAAGTAIAIEITPVAGATTAPYATINGQQITLTDGEAGKKVGSTTMPSANATLTVFSGATGGSTGDGSDQ